MGVDGGEREGLIFRDIRRYYCEYCGICRSKKALITSHIIASHQEDITEKESDGDMKVKKSNICEECGANFRKPAYLKQHMQSHSLERPYTCPVNDCNSSYRRKDHLTRHLIEHEGKLFACPIESCTHKSMIQGNVKRHVKQLHEGSGSAEPKGQKQYACQEIGCRKVFKFASKLRKHEDSHVKLDSVEAICSEPGCSKYFTNAQCLKAHIQSCHQHIMCETCGTKQLKKNIKRHLRTHEARGSIERIKCGFEGCPHTFSNKSNLRQHVEAVHHEVRPFACRMPDCGMKFSFKHVRDNHEKTGCHVYAAGDFEEADEQFRSKPRGGRKRKYPPIETLLRKRVTSLNQSDHVQDDEPSLLSWLLSRAASNSTV